MKPQRVRLYIKTHCPWCREALDWLKAHGIACEVRDVLTDASAFEEMVRRSGQSRAPVIDVDGKVLADFGAEEIAAWWPRQVGPVERVD